MSLYSDLNEVLTPYAQKIKDKADKSTTYTKTEVDDLISGVDVETDTTLEVSGAPADAAETGRQIGLINESLGNVQSYYATDIGSYNRFNYATAELGIITKNGSESASTSWMKSDYIPVKPGMVLYAYGHSASNFAMYDIGKNVVQNDINWANPFTVPANVFYIRMTFAKSSVEVAYLSTMNTYDKYMPLTERIGSTLFTNTENDITKYGRIVVGSYNSRGEITNVTNRLRVDTWIKVNAGDQIQFTPGSNCEQYAIGIYGADKSYIGEFLWLTSSYIIPNDGFVIIAFRKSDNSTIGAGDYDADTSIIKSWYARPSYNQKITKRNENHVKRDLNCTNLYDVSRTTYNWFLSIDGTEQYSDSWCASDFIEIDPSIKYELWNFNLKTKRTSNIYVVFYDIDKNYITGVQVRVVATENATQKNWLHDYTYPSNAAYIRLSFDGKYAPAVMLTEYKNGYPMIYRPYGFDINPVRVSQKYGNTINSVSKEGYNTLDRVTGFPTYPHSSIVSFIAAMEAGFNSLLFAVLYTTDGVPVLSHNDDISTIAMNSDGTSITSPYKITEHTFAEIDAYDYGIMYGPQYAGLHILKIEDGLRFCKEYGCSFMIEIESGETKERLNSIAAMVKMYGMEERCGFFAYDTAKLSDIPALLPYADISVGVPATDAATITLADRIDNANLKNGKNHVFIACQFGTSLTQETLNYIANKGLLLSYSNAETEPTDIANFFAIEKNLYVTRVTSRVYPAGKILYKSITEQLTAIVSE